MLMLNLQAEHDAPECEPLINNAHTPVAYLATTRACPLVANCVG